MHYYKRHLGDYARDTGHLTALEHGIYTLLLDWYYVNERPIPEDKAVRIARGNPEETQTVLREFFHLTSEGWRHHYADREIADYHKRAEHNRAVGKLGGRPARDKKEPENNPEETRTVSKREPRSNPQETLTTNHKPLTTNQEPEDQKKESSTDDSTPAVAGPVAVIAEVYHDMMTGTDPETGRVRGCARIEVWGPRRKKKAIAADKLAATLCKQRGWEYARRRAEFWRAYFAQCQLDPWLRGDRPNPNNPNWKQNLFVLIDEERFTTIMDKALTSMGAEHE